MWKLFSKGFKAVATGNAQSKLGMQSPHLPGAFVRIGRFIYSSALGWIAVCWYTGFVNKRTEAGEGPQLVIGGKVVNSPDRPDKGANIPTIGNDPAAAAGDPNRFVASSKGVAGRTLIAITSAQLNAGQGVNGYLWTAPNNKKQIPPFDRSRYNALLPVASSIANHFGMRITSGYRPQSVGSLHGAGIAFDMVGSMAQMKRAASWAATNPSLFQEIFIHDEGSGVHLHLGFYPDAAGIYNAGANRYVRPGGTSQSLAATAGIGHR